MQLDVVLLKHADGGRVAICPSLPQCKTYGLTVDEALEKHREALIGYLAVTGGPVPENLELQVVYQS